VRSGVSALLTECRKFIGLGFFFFFFFFFEKEFFKKIIERGVFELHCFWTAGPTRNHANPAPAVRLIAAKHRLIIFYI
jgi:hypothetical protein